MKNVIKESGVIIAIVFAVSIFTNTAFGQNSQICEKIVMEIYDGINQKKADHLVQYLSTDFSMAGQNGEIALQIFPVYITSLNDKVSDIKKLNETKTDVLTLDYEAKFEDMGTKKSTFVFDKNNKLIKMDLLPTKVKHEKG